MVSIALDVQKNYMITQRGYLQFQGMICTSQMENITSQLKAKASEENFDANDGEYIALKEEEKELTSTNETIETQLSELNEEIKSFKDLIKNNIKEDFNVNSFN